ncbi:DotI/IcmL family type IV secretion protein [Marinobacter gelidimuriae]|uniref:DotI/IcmL family type IV secretion protein n=1 Tax=Marinobacter gelidimuriae TaxID=2739064 RepID=UPI0003637A89|nr:DotI/IcmL family type IV secretion protein [Marinobacter gelidimuriae]
MTEPQDQIRPKRTPPRENTNRPAQKAASNSTEQRPQGQAGSSRKAPPPNRTSQSQGARRQVAPGAQAARNGAANEKGKTQLHGIEALAALTVAESKLSRFKGRVILGLAFILMISLGWNSVQSAFRPEPKLLALTQDGRVQPLPLLSDPVDSRQVLMDWVRRNVPNLFNFNYVNYRSQLQNALDFTQPVTLDRFREDIDSSGILGKVRDEFLILRATIVNEPLIVKEFVNKGRRIWVVEIPMDLIYDSGEVRDGSRRRINQNILFTAWIARSSIMEYDGGLMLAKYSIKTRRD